MHDSLALVNDYLDLLFTYGTFWVYVVVFVACLIENLFPPFPGDTFILATGGLIAMERLNVVISLFVIIAGGMSSVMILYWLGRRYGREFFIEKNYRFFPATDIYGMEKRFQRWGGLILVFSRFVVGARSALALVSGMSRYPTGRMVAFSIVSYLLFAGLLLVAAAALVENVDTVQRVLTTYSAIVWPVVIISFVVWLLHRIRKINRKVKR